jgi:hypothetical protein
MEKCDRASARRLKIAQGPQLQCARALEAKDMPLHAICQDFRKEMPCYALSSALILDVYCLLARFVLKGLGVIYEPAKREEQTTQVQRH